MKVRNLEHEIEQLIDDWDFNLDMVEPARTVFECRIYDAKGQLKRIVDPTKRPDPVDLPTGEDCQIPNDLGEWY